jgi:hypothetical protein
MPEPRASSDPPPGLWWPKRFLLGRMLAATRRRRRAPLAAVRAEAVEHLDRRRGRIPPAPRRRREVRSVVCILAGPNDRSAVFDSTEALLASDGDAAQVVVADDSSVAVRESIVRERFPEADVLRNPRATGGPPHLWALCRLGIERALERFDFEQWVKADSDALVTGPGFSARTLERLADAPEAGIAGCTGVRCDGVPTDYRYHAEVLARELPRDRTLRAAVERATARGWRLGECVHGGAFTVRRAACEAVAAQGWLAWRRPWHSLVNEDIALSLFVKAAGFELLSIGDPSGIFAVANKDLRLPKEEIAAGPWVIAHSVKLGYDGEDEAVLRTYFGKQRQSWPSP